MIRPVLALLTLVGVVVILSNSPLAAGGKAGKTTGKKGSQTVDAIIVTVDPKKHEISVTIHEEKGAKKGEKGAKKGKAQHFKLTEEVKIVDASGKAITLEVFKKGDEVKIVEIEGKVQELHQKGGASKGPPKKK